MLELLISLDDVVLHVGDSVDLTALPQDEAVALLRDAYAFMGAPLEVHIEEGLVHIRLPDSPDASDEALELYKGAVRLAERGNYPRAINLLTRVTQEAPTHVEARRNLGMAYLESGDVAEAQRHLEYALRLDPNDAWTYMLLGNLYSKHKGDVKTAEGLYSKAYQLNPDDAYLLTNLGALYAQTERLERAQALFDHAIEIDPRYPNAYYGAALVRMRQGEIEKALEALQALFAQPVSADIRHQPVYEEARRLYLKLNTRLVEQSFDSMMEVVEARRELLQRRAGIPVEILQDESLERVFAVAQAAWRHNRPFHRIRYRKIAGAATPHLVAHEIEHLLMEQEARDAGRNRFFVTTAETREWTIRRLSTHLRKLQRSGYSEDSITQVMLEMVDGLAQQLHSCPIDMFLEYRLFHDCPALRPSQLVPARKRPSPGGRDRGRSQGLGIPA